MSFFRATSKGAVSVAAAAALACGGLAATAASASADTPCQAQSWFDSINRGNSRVIAYEEGAVHQLSGGHPTITKVHSKKCDGNTNQDATYIIAAYSANDSASLEIKAGSWWKVTDPSSSNGLDVRRLNPQDPQAQFVQAVVSISNVAG